MMAPYAKAFPRWISRPWEGPADGGDANQERTYKGEIEITRVYLNGFLKVKSIGCCQVVMAYRLDPIGRLLTQVNRALVDCRKSIQSSR